MADPVVCCVMLTKDRPAMAKKAVECFLAQTYKPKRLCVYDTGTAPVIPVLPFEFPRLGITYYKSEVPDNTSIGQLRNIANQWAAQIMRPEILMHWDDDDWSDPNRITEQVQTLLGLEGRGAVGYNQMPFWKQEGEAWLYSNRDPWYCLGTSLCYWRSAWEKRHFDHTSQGEDSRWLYGVSARGVSSLLVREGVLELSQPRMIARIHAGNTSNAYDQRTMTTAQEWKRSPEWDAFCRDRMAL